MIPGLAGLVLPAWAKWVALAAVGAALYTFGQLDGRRAAGEIHTDYVMAQAAQTVRIVQAQAKVVEKIEIVYRDKIQKIYVQGEKNEVAIKELVQPVDDLRFGVNVGFVRSFNAAWSGEPVGPAADADREPAGLPISEVAEVENHNATACRAWKEQALGWRAFYAEQQAVINGPPK